MIQNEDEDTRHPAKVRMSNHIPYLSLHVLYSPNQPTPPPPPPPNWVSFYYCPIYIYCYFVLYLDFLRIYSLQMNSYIDLCFYVLYPHNLLSGERKSINTILQRQGIFRYWPIIKKKKSPQIEKEKCHVKSVH